MQTLKNVEKTYRGIAVFDMPYDEFKRVCRKGLETSFYSFFSRQILNKMNENRIFFRRRKQTTLKANLKLIPFCDF